MGIEYSEISNFLITEDKTILQAMELLEKSARKILFIHNEKILLAALTDGDIRRWILSGEDLNASITKVANYQPIYLEEDSSHLAKKIIKEKRIDAIPIVDKNKKIIKIYFQDELKIEINKFKKAIPVVIVAGGIGSRLSPYTNILPKPLIPIGELPIVEHIINQFKKYGCDDFRMIVNYKKNMIKAYFNELNKDYTVTYIAEDRALGTGGGLSLMKGTIESTFVLTNCDILIEDDLNKIYEHHIKAGNLITVICSLKKITIPYGVINIGKSGNIVSMQEKPDITFYTNTGCYFVEPKVIDDLKFNEPIDFPEIISRYMAEGEKVGVYPIGENSWLDMGQFDELEKMKVRLGY